MSEYDSKSDTLEHIQHIRDALGWVNQEIIHKAQIHDRTKLWPQEKEAFDRATPRLKKLEYGSPEYKESLDDINSALEHHYAHHRHHPNHFKNGILGMNLIDVIEMIVDWHASVKRHENGDIMRSIEINQERFGYSDELKQLLINTAEWLRTQEANATGIYPPTRNQSALSDEKG